MLGATSRERVLLADNLDGAASGDASASACAAAIPSAPAGDLGVSGHTVQCALELLIGSEQTADRTGVCRSHSSGGGWALEWLRGGLPPPGQGTPAAPPGLWRALCPGTEPEPQLSCLSWVHK